MSSHSFTMFHSFFQLLHISDKATIILWGLSFTLKLSSIQEIMCAKCVKHTWIYCISLSKTMNSDGASIMCIKTTLSILAHHKATGRHSKADKTVHPHTYSTPRGTRQSFLSFHSKSSRKSLISCHTPFTFLSIRSSFSL